jgi:hypothetical protein
MSVPEARSSGVADAWKAAWSSAAFRVQVAVTVPVLIVVLSLFSRFLEWVEVRSGSILQDPIIAFTTPHQFTWPIFILIYVGLIVGLVTLSTRPRQLIVAFQAYTLMVCIRFVSMYLTPFDPPAGIIPLADPFVQFFGSGSVPTKDLFFSGHTATLLLLSFTAERDRTKLLFAACAAVVGVLIVWQHVHYAIDVVMAPFVAYTSYRIAILGQRWFAWIGGNA